MLLEKSWHDFCFLEKDLISNTFIILIQYDVLSALQSLLHEKATDSVSNTVLNFLLSVCSYKSSPFSLRDGFIVARLFADEVKQGERSNIAPGSPVATFTNYTKCLASVVSKHANKRITKRRGEQMKVF